VDMIGALDGAMWHDPEAANSVNAVSNDANVQHDERAPPAIPLWSVSHAGNPAVMAMTTASDDHDEDPIGRVPAALLETNHPTSSATDTRKKLRQLAPAPSNTSSVQPDQLQDAELIKDPYSTFDHGAGIFVRGHGTAVDQTIQYPPIQDPATSSAITSGSRSVHLCRVCFSAFPSSEKLASHARREKHRTCKCPVTTCGLTFLQPDGLAEHMQRRLHNEGGGGPRGRECKCTVCETQFPSVTQLQEHARATDHATLHCVNT
jgi:hypothetical protein